MYRITYLLCHEEPKNIPSFDRLPGDNAMSFHLSGFSKPLAASTHNYHYIFFHNI